jgi:hypothetical protein
MIFLRLKIGKAPVSQLFWLLCLSVTLQVAAPAHAHDDSAERAQLHHVCSLCSLIDDPLKLALAFDVRLLEFRVRDLTQDARDRPAVPSGLHFVRPPARAPPPKTS